MKTNKSGVVRWVKKRAEKIKDTAKSSDIIEERIETDELYIFTKYNKANLHNYIRNKESCKIADFDMAANAKFFIRMATPIIRRSRIKESINVF